MSEMKKRKRIQKNSKKKKKWTKVESKCKPSSISGRGVGLLDPTIKPKKAVAICERREVKKSRKERKKKPQEKKPKKSFQRLFFFFPFGKCDVYIQNYYLPHLFNLLDLKSLFAP